MRLIDADKTLETLEGLTELVIGEGAALVKALTFAALKSESVVPTIGGWISAKDRLPESNEAVLVAVYDSDGQAYHTIAVHYPCGDWDCDDDYFNMSEDEVRYWMPLPEPPEEVSGDG